MTTNFDTGLVDFLNTIKTANQNKTAENVLSTNVDQKTLENPQNSSTQTPKPSKVRRNNQATIVPANLVALGLFMLMLIFLSMNGADWFKKWKVKRKKHNCDTKKNECSSRHGNLAGSKSESPEEEYERIAATAHKTEFLQQPDLQSRSARVCDALLPKHK